MTTIEDELRVALQGKAESLPLPERPPIDPPVAPDRSGRSRWLIVAACLVFIVGGLFSFVQHRTGEPATVESGSEVTTAPASVRNGWVALTLADEGDFDIYLVRPGHTAQRLAVAGTEASSESCPAWSPDGTRLMFGRLTGSSATTPGRAELVIVPVDQAGAAGAPTVITLDGFEASEGTPSPPPCGTWASDGRWVALQGQPDEVWVVDTQTSQIRRLPNLRPLDLEWRPSTDELAIAGEVDPRDGERTSTPVSLYSASTGEIRQMGAVRAASVTWSPDGSAMAYTDADQRSGEDDGILWLVDADGGNPRVLVDDIGDAVHGFGPVWSPSGDRIVYQRLCCGIGSERHEVVLVSVPDGAETVIEPPRAEGLDTVRWYPFNVSWSPDGTTLLYTAWRAPTGPTAEPVDGRAHVLSLRPDSPDEVTVLSRGGADHQGWGAQPR